MEGEIIQTGNTEIVNSLENVLNLGSHSRTDFILPFGVGILVFFRVVVLIRVAKDINIRSKNIFVFILSLLCILIFTPFFGFFLYLALRPKTTLSERLMRRETLELNAVECGNCKELNDIHHKFCTGCGGKLVVKCHECSKEISSSYGYCPFCGAPNIE